METKVKKFIRNTPEEDLKNFLISNDFIEVPEDFIPIPIFKAVFS